MHFFGIGAWEIFIVLLIALLVLGPQRLPQVAVQLARWLRSLRRFAGEVTGQLRREFDDLIREYEELKQEVAELRQRVDRDTASINREVKETIEATRKAVPRGPILETSAEPLPDDKSVEPSSTP